MDNERQIRLNFLDEAQEYFDTMESNLLGLGDSPVDAKKVDVILRAAHSVKGGAAMMGFLPLSQTAHRIEDFLKILRVRYSGQSIDVTVEKLLLQTVDALRSIGNLNRQGQDVEDDVLANRAQPLFDQLQEILGVLDESDETALIAQDEGDNPALVLFEDGVLTVLAEFETASQSVTVDELRQLLSATAQELVEFGNMAQIPAFGQLCQSIEELVNKVPNHSISALKNKALKAWKRSHSLVMRGSIEKLPTQLKGVEDWVQHEEILHLEITEIDEDLLGLSADCEAPQVEQFDIADIDPTSFGTLFNEIDNQPSDSLEPVTLDLEETDSLPDFEDLNIDLLQDALADAENSCESVVIEADEAPSEEAFTQKKDTAEPLTDSSLIPEQTKALLDRISQKLKLNPAILYELINQKNSVHLDQDSNDQAAARTVDKMVRVPASQLQQFNGLFEQLILHRNSINLKLQQFRNTIQLMGQRISQIENSNVQLKQWYDRASLEGFLNYGPDRSGMMPALSQDRGMFDSLEMDRYSDIHLICQAQIETIVQLQEVATDMQLGLSDIFQSVDALNYTTKSMQGNVTQTQMIPFKEVVKRCPRIIRDLNLQYNKQVSLEIMGEATLLDRRVAEVLNDPLMHLLRNAFDHGIEDAETRTQQGKDSGGCITIQASNQGTYTVVKIQDDGAGLPLDKIRDRIVKMGIPRQDVDRLEKEDLLEFIFEPGFSTADKVTELSGRGVGMDVVKANLDELQGHIRVSSEPGQGTTFTIRIPYTLSILRVAVVEQEGMFFAIPANAIEEMIEFDALPMNLQSSIPSMSWSDQQIPVIELEKALLPNRAHQKMQLTGSPTIDTPMAIIIKNDRRHAVLKVSRFWYEQESTIRPIDSPIPLPTGIISSVVFGDGKVIPLIDPSVVIDPYLAALSNPHHDISNSAQLDSNSSHTSILIVDDSINVRRYLAHTLEKAGYVVEQAKDGQDAVELLTNGLSVSAVICDIEMPRLDGYGFLEEIKGQTQFEDLPVVMLTSRSNEKHRTMAMNLGATDYFSKPYNEIELMTRLSELTHSQDQVVFA